MVFEIIDKTLSARIGKIYTAKGFIETPALLPVISVSPKTEIIVWLKELGCRSIITNAYLLWKKLKGKKINIHEYFSFPYPIMTDSGGYQILKYGEVEITPLKSLLYQISISSDICTLLDYPTGLTHNLEEAKRSVNLTIRRAKMAKKILDNTRSLIVAPIQGGFHYNLLRKCARDLRNLDYPYYAIGSPTGLMEKYEYAKVLKMVLIVKLILGPQYPIHLFGAGHPMFFPFIVALGIDTFDSAAYSIYAKDNRYLTRSRTYRLEDLNYFPCNCDICRKWETSEFKRLNETERKLLLEKHNLYVSLEEIKHIKLHIEEGTLWNYLQEKARVHPALFSAFLFIKDNIKYLTKYHPISKADVSGIFFFDKVSSIHPDVIIYRKKFIENFKVAGPYVLLIPFTSYKPFSRSKETLYLIKLLLSSSSENILQRISIIYYGYPFLLVPLELSETYPTAQWEGKIGSCYIDKSFQSHLKDIFKIDSILKIIIFYDKKYKRLLNILLDFFKENNINFININMNDGLIETLKENENIILKELNPANV